MRNHLADCVNSLAAKLCVLSIALNSLLMTAVLEKRVLRWQSTSVKQPSVWNFFFRPLWTCQAACNLWFNLQEGVNRETDQRILKIFNFAQFSDSKRDFYGFPDPGIAADCGSIYFLGPDFGLCVQLKYFCPDFRFRAKVEGQIWWINHSGSAICIRLFTPFFIVVAGNTCAFSFFSWCASYSTTSLKIVRVGSPEGGTPYNGLYWSEEASLERDIFFRVQVYERIGISLIGHLL